MSPEKNGYEMVEQNDELKHILDSSSQIESAFDYEKYGRVYTEGGESPFSKTAISITVQTDLT